MEADWTAVAQELEIWQRAGQQARLWLRDDDAVAATSPLDHLLSLSDQHEAPVLLGIIPLLAESSLRRRLAGALRVTVAMHGARHCNRATESEKKQEFPASLGQPAILAALSDARGRLVGDFGQPAGIWYIPPWNRIAPEVAALLPEAGFGALSCFADADHGVAGLAQHNTQVDLMDWRAGRIGKSPDRVASELARALVMARSQRFHAVGVLAHHLVHDASAWRSLSELLEATASHPAARWIGAAELLSWPQRNASPTAGGGHDLTA